MNNIQINMMKAGFALASIGIAGYIGLQCYAIKLDINSPWEYERAATEYSEMIQNIDYASSYLLSTSEKDKEAVIVQTDYNKVYTYLEVALENNAHDAIADSEDFKRTDKLESMIEKLKAIETRNNNLGDLLLWKDEMDLFREEVYYVRNAYEDKVERYEHKQNKVEAGANYFWVIDALGVGILVAGGIGYSSNKITVTGNEKTENQTEVDKK